MLKLQNMIARGKYYSFFINIDLAKLLLMPRNNTQTDITMHVDAAVQWICRAQDAFSDDGVARSYSLIYHPYFKRQGWIHSYPETTGYIIPTMFDYAHLTNRQDIFDRAVRMTEWECDVQMENGAAQGGTIDQPASPAIFNTGQVIFGWIRAFQETGKEQYLDCAIKAGNFLVQNQDRDGAWRKNLSKYASDRMPFYTYNTRTAWALLLLSTINNNTDYKEAAIQNIEFALTQQLENGWFRNNCLALPETPLLHTIAYCIRGILEAGVLLNNQRYIHCARKAADALLANQRSDGSLAGCFNEHWRPAVSWSCLTGDAQISGIWGRLYQITAEPKYFEPMIRINEYLRRLQFLQKTNPEIYGGIAGSYPLHGAYGRFEILNWAVKFFIDALLTEIVCKKRMLTTRYPEDQKDPMESPQVGRETGKPSLVRYPAYVLSCLREQIANVLPKQFLGRRRNYSVSR